MRANERTDERVAQYSRLYSCLFQTTVRAPEAIESSPLLESFRMFFTDGTAECATGGIANSKTAGAVYGIRSEDEALDGILEWRLESKTSGTAHVATDATIKVRTRSRWNPKWYIKMTDKNKKQFFFFAASSY